MLPERDRVFVVLGQAARGTSPEVQAAHPEIPWRQMIGMRNVVVHDYADVDLTLVWKTVNEDLPGLMARLRVLLSQDVAS
jgi:uncharacterized protein with HEPN domain